MISYVSGVSEHLRHIFSKHSISVAFKPQNTLRQNLVHLKDRVPWDKQSCLEDGRELYIREPIQPLGATEELPQWAGTLWSI